MEHDAVETMEEDARGSSCARAGLVELVDNARAECQVGPVTAETSYGSYCHDYVRLTMGRKASRGS